ncbi:MAG: hypothetical protein ABIZ49_07925, partial [Opitutaceae bacterium]
MPTRFFSATASLGTALLTCTLVAFFPPRDTHPDSLDRFGAAAPHLALARQHAARIIPAILGAAAPGDRTLATREVERRSLGAALADYANNPGGDPQQCEDFASAAKRIIAGGTTAKRPPDAASLLLDETAAAVLAAVRAAELAAGPTRPRHLDAALDDLRARA